MASPHSAYNWAMKYKPCPPAKTLSLGKGNKLGKVMARYNMQLACVGVCNHIMVKTTSMGFAVIQVTLTRE